MPSQDSSDPELQDNVVIIAEQSVQGKPPRHPTSSSSADPLSSSTSGKRKKYSPNWDHFDEIPGTDFAKCKYCDARFGCATANGTTPLKNHTLRCKKYPANIDKKQKLMDIERKTVIGPNRVVEFVSVPCSWRFESL